MTRTNKAYTIADLKRDLRIPYIWPGGHPTFFVTSDGGALSHDSVKENLRAVMESMRDNLRDGWKVERCVVNWEDPHLYCDHSGERIESAYAED